MEEQAITITLEEYKQLRDIAESYQELIGKYNLLSYDYQLRIQQPEEEKVKVKNKIGFQPSKS